MPLRAIQIFASKKHKKRIESILKERGALDYYSHDLDKSKTLIRAFVPSEKTEQVLDVLETYFSEEKDFRIVIVPVEASLPRQENSKEAAEEDGEEKNHAGRVSREELYANISRTADFSHIYILLIFLSSLVAALGLIYGNSVAIIGAMVITPLFGPNIALALATALADAELAKKSIKTLATGLIFALAVSALIGWFLNVDPLAPEIAARTRVSLADIAIALAAGSAGVIGLTSGYFLGSLMGVMIAVALLPPLVVFGMLMGAGIWEEAFPAFLLLMTNFVCINLSGVATFIFLKIKPRTWWEADKAKMAANLVIAIWITLLLLLLLLVLLMENRIDVPV